MRIPGVNLYRIATKVISPQPILYYEDAGRVQDAQRNWVTRYNEPKTIMASVQAVLREKYTELGLEFQKNYVKIFVDKDVVDIDRDASGDYFIFGGKTYKLADETTWFEQDGWTGCLAVEIKQSFPVQPVGP